MRKSNITAVILTSNSGKYVKHAIESVLWCGEIIIIDDYSSDNIHQIAKKIKAKIYTYPVSDDFSKARNFALKKAKYSWVIFVDSDEFVTDPLKREIVKIIDSESIYEGYYIHRVDCWKGKYMQSDLKSNLPYGDIGNTYIIRLGNKKSGKWYGKVHETWKIRRKIGKINADLLHFPHQSISSFIDKIDFYSKRHVYEKIKSKNIFLRIVFFPFFKFIYMYFYLKGYKNGIHGLIYSSMMSAHSFFSWTRLWFIKTKKIKYI